MASPKPTKEAELLQLGQKLQNFYNSGYVNKKQAILFSFYKGLASGLGAFLGGTIVIALLLWILSFFSQVPFAPHLITTIRQELHK
jgi:uncharacterized protein DUF5665